MIKTFFGSADEFDADKGVVAGSSQGSFGSTDRWTSSLIMTQEADSLDGLGSWKTSATTFQLPQVVIAFISDH